MADGPIGDFVTRKQADGTVVALRADQTIWVTDEFLHSVHPAFATYAHDILTLKGDDGEVRYRRTGWGAPGVLVHVMERIA